MEFKIDDGKPDELKQLLVTAAKESEAVDRNLQEAAQCGIAAADMLIQNGRASKNNPSRPFLFC